MNDPSSFSYSMAGPSSTAVLVLADGTVFYGRGVGAFGTAIGEICFNTSMTGYQEILTDPSYAEQIITFTFPHIGNVGTNNEDIESLHPVAKGLVLRADISAPSNFRSAANLDHWLKEHGLVGITGLDTRGITARIRESGHPNGIIAYQPSDKIDVARLHQKASSWGGLLGRDLASSVTCSKPYTWSESLWTLEQGYKSLKNPIFHVVAIDYGIKRNILRCLAAAGCRVTVVPANTNAKDILHYKPDGIFLSNGPGDPAATSVYAVPILKQLIQTGIPIFGICLGHQLLALSLGARTEKMHQGHRGANHPVKDLVTGKVEITSQNHGFVVDEDSLPPGVNATHVSLFDKSLEGINVQGKPISSVQYHPEASPGPQDSNYLFDNFFKLMEVS